MKMSSFLCKWNSFYKNGFTIRFVFETVPQGNSKMAYSCIAWCLLWEKLFINEENVNNEEKENIA